MEHILIGHLKLYEVHGIRVTSSAQNGEADRNSTTYYASDILIEGIIMLHECYVMHNYAILCYMRCMKRRLNNNNIIQLFNCNTSFFTSIILYKFLY